MSNTNSGHKWPQDLFNIAPVGLALVRKRIFVDVNNRFCELFGYAPNELIGQKTSICYADKKEYERAGLQLYEQIRQSGQANLEARAKRKDGTLIDVLISTSIFNQTDKDSEFAFAVIDITDRNKAKEDLRIEKEFTETAINAQIDTLFIFEPSTGKPIRWNKAFSRISGYTDEEIALMKAPDDWYDKEDLEKVGDLINTITKDGHATVDLSLLTKNGKRIPTEYRASFINDAEGSPKYVIAIGRDLTNRMQAEKKLEQEQYFSESIIQTSPAYFIAIDAEGKTKVMNQTMLISLGYKADEVIGIDYIKTFIPQADRQKVHEIFGKLINLNEPTINENNILTKDGQVLLVEWHGQPVYDANGRFDFFFGVGIDITKRKQAEKALQKSEDKLLEAQKIAHLGYYIFDIKAGYWMSSSELNDIFGINKKYKKDLNGWLNIIHPDYKNSMQDFLQNDVLGRRIKFDKEYKIIDASSGQEKWVHGLGSLKNDENNNPVEMFGTIQDITERRRAEEEIKKFKTISDRANYGTAIADIDGNIIYINECFASMHGLQIKEVIGKHLSIFHTDEQMAAVSHLNKKLIRDGSYSATEVWHKKKDGSVFPTMMNATIITDENNKSLHISASAIDITELKQAAKDLLESEAKFRGLVESSSDWIWEVNKKGIYTYASPQVKSILGYDPQEIIGKTPFDLMRPEGAKQIKKIFTDLIKAGKPIITIENISIHKDGRPIVLETSGVPFTDEAGNIIGYRGVDRDITNRKQTEKLISTQRTLAIKLGTVSQLENISTLCIDAATEITGMDSGGIYLIDDSSGDVDLKASIGLSDDFIEDGLHYDADSDNTKVIMAGKPLYLTGKTLTSLQTPVQVKEGLLSLAIIPIRHEDKVIACLNVASHKKEDILPIVKNSLESLVAQMGSVIARAKSQEALVESEKEYKILFEKMIDGFALHEIICDDSGKPIDYRFLAINPAFERFTGLKKEDVIGKRAYEVIPDIEPIWIQKYGSVAQTGDPIHFEEYSAPFDKYFEITAYRPTDGQFACLFVDITERRKAEIALEEITDRLRDEQNALLNKNIALKQILEHMETEKTEFKHEISSSIERALMPFIKNLSKRDKVVSQKDLEEFEDIIKSITGIGIDEFKANYAKLTSREMDVCELIKKGKSSQEIADDLHLSLQTIQKHRSSIRSKLQLKNKEINLPAFLRYK